MKIIVLHGDDSERSYARLTKFIDTAKKRSWEIVTNEFPNTPSLFGTERLIIYRDYKLLTKLDIKNFDRFDGTLVVYNEGILPITFLKSLPKDTKVEKFELPKLLWHFLDNMTIKNLHEVVKHEPVEFVFAMIAWKMRQKYLRNPTPDVGFLISKLAEIDMDVKTGKANLLTSLDLMIVKQLK